MRRPTKGTRSRDSRAGPARCRRATSRLLGLRDWDLRVWEEHAGLLLHHEIPAVERLRAGDPEGSIERGLRGGLFYVGPRWPRLRRLLIKSRRARRAHEGPRHLLRLLRLPREAKPDRR